MSNKCLYFVVKLLPCHINAERSSGCFRTFAGNFSPLLCAKAAIIGKKRWYEGQEQALTRLFYCILHNAATEKSEICYIAWN